MKTSILLGAGAVALFASCVISFPEADYKLQSATTATSSPTGGAGGSAGGSSTSSSSSASSTASSSGGGGGASSSSSSSSSSTSSSSGLGGGGSSTSSASSSSGGPTCGDGAKNGAETDVDCGGGTCLACAFDRACESNGDCVSASCVAGHCAATCNDLEKDGAETDVDCGGLCPTKCAAGKACGANPDCASGKCAAGACTDVLLISEVQTFGSAGSGDEFFEIYNPNAFPVTFDASWEVWARDVVLPCTALTKRFAGTGQVIPALGHLLYASFTAYDGATSPDTTYMNAFDDAGQIVLLHSAALVDSLCYSYDATSLAKLTCATPPAMWFPCQGSADNNPHNGVSQASSTVDVSIERKPGGALGNGQNTGDNTMDFVGNAPSNPQNLASPPTP